MPSHEKYSGIYPAFYACYNHEGMVDASRVRMFTRYLISKGVQGLYVGGTSGECIYQSVQERKLILENVLCEAKGKVTVIAHVACNNTADSCLLAKHAQEAGVDAIAAIPPIYFKLPPHAIADYWNEISSNAPATDFFIYNIPRLAGVELTVNLLQEMLKNPRVVGVKNSSPSAEDIQKFRSIGGKDFVVFNGPDEQFISGRVMGAVGGIGGTYGVMPELFLKANAFLLQGDLASALAVQDDIDCIIRVMQSCKGNLYAVEKEVLRMHGVDIGGVRKPLPALYEQDLPAVKKADDLITASIKHWCMDS